MKKLVIFCIALSLPLFAQEPTPRSQQKPTLEDYEKGVPVLVQQRNQLSVALLDAQAQIQVLTTENAELKSRIAALEKPDAKTAAK